MTVNSRILSLLEDTMAHETDVFLKQAHLQGEAVYASLIQDAQKRFQVRERKAQEETAFLKQRESARNINRLKLKVNEAKLKAVETLLDEVHQELKALEITEYVDLLIRCVYSQDTDEIPRIHVPSAYLDDVTKHLGQTFQVISDDDLEDGFILSYKHYDINMELKQIIRHNKDRLTQKAMDLLFGGDDA